MRTDGGFENGTGGDAIEVMSFPIAVHDPGAGRLVGRDRWGAGLSRHEGLGDRLQKSTKEHAVQQYYFFHIHVNRIFPLQRV